MRTDGREGAASTPYAPYNRTAAEETPDPDVEVEVEVTISVQLGEGNRRERAKNESWSAQKLPTDRGKLIYCQQAVVFCPNLIWDLYIQIKSWLQVIYVIKNFGCLLRDL